MKKLKSILSLITAAVMLFTIAACRKKDKDEWIYSEEWQEITDNSSVDSEDTITSSSGKTGDKKFTNSTENQGLINSEKLTPQEEYFSKAKLKGTTLTVVVGSDEDVNKYPQTKYAFDKLKNKWGINVKTVVYSNSQLPNMVATLVASGNPPDVAHAASTNLMRYVYSNLAVSIDKHIVKEDPVWENGDAFTGCVFNGKTYAISWSGLIDSTYFVWYNKTYLKEKGVEDPYELYKAGQWTVEKFKSVAQACKTYAANGKDVAVNGVGTWDYSVFLAMNGATGITETSNNKWQVTIDTPNAMKGLQLISDLAKDGTYVASGAGFKDRKLAMHIERAPNAIKQYDLYNTMNDEIGMVPLPMASDGKYYAYTVSDASFFLKNGKNPIGAVAYRYYDRLFLRHASIEEQKAAGYDPLEKVAFSDEHRKIAEDFVNNKCAKILDDKIYALSNWYSGNNLSKAFWSSIIVDGKQPAQVVDSAKSQISKCLKETVGVGNVAS